jgi:hypothetical protein
MFQKEGGLLGSQAVAKDYEARSVNVVAMNQVCLLLTILTVLILVLVRHDCMGQGCSH